MNQMNPFIMQALQNLYQGQQGTQAINQMPNIFGNYLGNQPSAKPILGAPMAPAAAPNPLFQSVVGGKSAALGEVPPNPMWSSLYQMPS